jgi:hypothetical protein
MSHTNRMSRKSHSTRSSHWIPTNRHWNRMTPMNHTSRRTSRSYRMTRTNDGDDDARLPRCWPP